MDYFDRLIQRAQAQPRDADAPLFDPFEAVAYWPLQATPNTRPVATTKPLAGHAAAEPGSTRLGPGATPPAPATHSPTTIFPVSLPPAEAQEPATVRAEDSTAPGSTPVAHLGDSPVPRPPRGADVLARADAFMHTLSVPGVPAAPLAQAAGAPPAVPALGPVAPLGPAKVHTVPPALPLTATRLQPPAPPPVATPSMASRAAHPGAPPPTSPSHTHAPPPRRAAPAPVVQTTVVVAPLALALDDLAHSAGIVGFGLGQL